MERLSILREWVGRVIATVSGPKGLSGPQDADVGGVGVAGSLPALWQLIRKLAMTVNIWLWVFVFFPTLCAAVYYFGIASDLYVSETDFLVRSQSAQSAPSGLLGTLLQSSSVMQSSGLSSSLQDTNAVNAFIMSRDAVRLLERNNNLRDVFNRPEADFVTRFPNFSTNSSFEKLYQHYSGFVTVVIDGETGVTKLTVEAYRPEDAQMITQALLSYSEDLVNRLNQRAEEDMVATARQQVQTAEDNLAAIQAARASLGQTPSLGRLAGGQNSAPASSFSDIDRIELQRDLAQKSLASAVTALETAEVEAQSHHLYIEHVSEPNLPDYPLYPRRTLSFIMVMVTCFVSYGIAWLLITGIREHGSA
jgi:capsular polysaccharide transport system permease protein